MKLTQISAAVLSASMLFVAASASAADEAVTTAGGVAFTSDYLFRGISQSSNNAAVQGTLTVNHESGLYFTAWGSSIASIASGAGGLELDTLLGFAGKAGEVGYDVGVMRYNYPGLNSGNAGFEPDYNEIYGSVSFKGAKLGLNYSPDYYLESDKFIYVYGAYSTEVGGVGLSASVGLNMFDDNAMMAQALGYAGTDDSYIDYKLAASKSLKGVGLELAYIGSDIDEDDLGGKLSSGRAVLTVSKSF
jgi:uncharacterized protein (TIGR02001 family)